MNTATPPGRRAAGAVAATLTLALSLVLVAVGAPPAAAQTTGAVTTTLTDGGVTASRGGRIDYTATVRNTGADVPRATFEVNLSTEDVALVAGSFTSSLGTTQVRSVFGGRNNLLVVSFGTLRRGASATIRWSVAVAAGLSSNRASLEQAGTVYTVAADGFQETVATTGTEVTPLAVQPPRLFVSRTETRTNPLPLQGAAQTVSGVAYIFVQSDPNIREVRFWLDADPATSAPRSIERSGVGGWDFAGTRGSGGPARPFDTRTLVDGTHCVTAEALLASGVRRQGVGCFEVAN